MKRELVELIALLEAGIDFAEDDVSVAPDAVILERIAQVRAPLVQLAGSFSYGKIVREGLTLAIVGRPNVGKSSLFNRLVERERAIVTAQPGTTRDLVSETVAIGGIPVELVDTAGIRRALDEAESIGIRKSMEALADADLVLVVVDASQPPDTTDHELLEQVAQRAAVAVLNKCDLAAGAAPPVEAEGAAGNAADSRDRTPVIRASALTGEGITELRQQILYHVRGDRPQQESAMLTNLRQQEQVTRTLAALDAASTSVGGKHAARDDPSHLTMPSELWTKSPAPPRLTTS